MARAAQGKEQEDDFYASKWAQRASSLLVYYHASNR